MGFICSGEFTLGSFEGVTQSGGRLGCIFGQSDIRSDLCVESKSVRSIKTHKPLQVLHKHEPAPLFVRPS